MIKMIITNKITKIKIIVKIKGITNKMKVKIKAIKLIIRISSTEIIKIQIYINKIIRNLMLIYKLNKSNMKHKVNYKKKFKKKKSKFNIKTMMNKIK